jgi:chromosome segregation protein
MFLRSLTLRGFKSFADKTVLEFVPGASVIVGPNGSGKSNLVDAISWALGEQGPRALRGGQMADVIFAGSPARSALGMAEVRLVIDNTAGLIPVPLSEIEVSRTIFRSGDSEYRIGGQVCRLLDLQELLSETGIGRALHTVVGQGQLEEVLHARPEERRQYIEEAAGIAKHRRRRERAQRKLASLEQDVLRLQDVISELKRQLKPLKQQAESARRHEELTAQAGELSWRLAAARLRALFGEREARSGGWDRGLEDRNRARTELDRLDARIEEVAGERERATAELWAAEAAFGEAQAARSAAELELRTAVDKDAAARERLAGASTRESRIAALSQELDHVASELAALGPVVEEKELELDRADAAFRREEAARRDVVEERARLNERAAARRAEVETIRRALASSEDERAKVDASLSELRERARERARERDSLTERIESLDAAATGLTERTRVLDERRSRLAGEVETLDERVRRHEARSDLLRARRKDLEETPGSRFLERGGRRAIGLLRDLVRVEPAFRASLATALGSFADAVVFERESDALSAAPSGGGAWLAIAQGGPVSFVLPGERSLLSKVTAEPPARGLISTVLRDIYVADDLADAVAKRAKHPKASFVTPDGVLLGPALIRTSVSADARGKEIREELAVVEHDLAAARSTLRPKRAALEKLLRESEALAVEMDASDAELTAAAERMGRATADLASLAREEELLTGRLSGLDESATALRVQLASASTPEPALPALPPLPEPPLRARVDVEALRRDRAGLEARRERLDSDRTTLEGEDAGAMRKALEAAQEARAGAEVALRAAEDAVDGVSARRTEAAVVERTATDAEGDVNRRWREAAAELERLRETYADEDRARGDLDRRISDAETLLRSGHGRDPGEAVQALAEDETVPALERKAELISRRLGLLGRVNLLATGEFEAVQERYDFMARELNDVRSARRDLLELIQRIDLEISASFDAAFRDVATEFEKLFEELFPGGEGKLALTDPSDLLATGLEIEARPGRKRVRRISLLSGGERALCAMAFLFAIFRARPSPFYLLDEVEPALDDVNLHRFLRLIESFARDSQVLVVTHQKRTMEMAEMLYGVSMAKDGTSRVVCQRFEAAQRGSASAASAAAKSDAESAPETGDRSVVVPEAGPVR